VAKNSLKVTKTVTNFIFTGGQKMLINSSLVNFVAAKSVKKEKDGLSVQIEVIMKLQFCKLA
jgi:hypothetical protein